MSGRAGNKTFFDFFLFAEAWFFLAIARLMLITMPFKKVAPLLGKDAGTKQAHGDITLLKKIQTAILRGSHYSFWRTKCFEQAIAAKIMLHRRHRATIIYFGVSNSTGSIKAHAWLNSDGYTVTGGKGSDSFTVITTF